MRVDVLTVRAPWAHTRRCAGLALPTATTMATAAHHGRTAAGTGGD